MFHFTKLSTISFSDLTVLQTLTISEYWVTRLSASQVIQPLSFYPRKSVLAN